MPPWFAGRWEPLLPSARYIDKSNLSIRSINLVNIERVLLSQIEAFLTIAERRSVSAAAAGALRHAAGADDAAQEPRARARGRALRPHAARDAADCGGARVPAARAARRPVARRRPRAAARAPRGPGRRAAGRRGAGDLHLRAPARPPPLPDVVPERAPDRAHRPFGGGARARAAGAGAARPRARAAAPGGHEPAARTTTRSCSSSHPGHRFADEPSIAVQELGAERLILFDRTSSYFVLTSAFFREAGVVPRGVMELDNVDATKKMVEHGLGIAFLPYTAVRGELAPTALLREVAIAGYEPVRRPIVALSAARRGRARGSGRRPARVRPPRRAGALAPLTARSSRGPSRPARP